jgi:hypothetical protein
MNTTNSDMLLYVLIVSLAALALLILYLLTLKGVLQEINAGNRKMRVEHIWLLLIPVFNFFWYPRVVHRLGLSIRAEYLDRGWHVGKRTPGEITGYIAFVALLLFLMLGKFFLFVAVISGVIHWLQIYSVKAKMEGLRDIL